MAQMELLEMSYSFLGGPSHKGRLGVRYVGDYTGVPNPKP